MGEQYANGWRVSRHRLVADATVGVIANPMSDRDIRRLVASASVFPNARRPRTSTSASSHLRSRCPRRRLPGPEAYSPFCWRRLETSSS
jgi:hypothetical protein